MSWAGSMISLINLSNNLLSLLDSVKQKGSIRVWLIPSTSSPSSADQGSTTKPSASPSKCSGTCPEWWVTLSGKPQRRPCSSPVWKSRGYHKLLCGATKSKSWTPDLLGDGSMSLSPRPRVSLTLAPGRRKVSTTGEATETRTVPSLMSCESSTSAARRWCGSRTSEDGSLADISDDSEKTYNSWVTRSKSRSSSLQATLEHRISESESLSWGTALSNHAGGTAEDFLRRKQESVARGNSMGIVLSDLNLQVSLWATTTTKQGGAEPNRTRRSEETDLKTQTYNFAEMARPSPRAEDSESAGNHPGRMDSLQAVAKQFLRLWPTTTTPPHNDSQNTIGRPRPSRPGYGEEITTAIGTFPCSRPHGALIWRKLRKSLRKLSRPKRKSVLLWLRRIWLCESGAIGVLLQKWHRPSCPRLNPAFQWWLMGWLPPRNFYESGETEWSLYRSLLRSSAFGLLRSTLSAWLPSNTKGLHNMPVAAPQQPAQEEWKQKRTKRLIVSSATQHETFELCKRKWWLGSVRGLKQPTTKSQAFGTVLHGVCERYLLADDLGRDRRAGQPVDLYPAGWHIAKSRFNDGEIEGEATPEEQDIIKRLISEAIDSGVLERRPGRRIEQQFRRTVLTVDCPECDGDGETGLGVIDNDEVDYDTRKCSTCKGDGKGTQIAITGFMDVAYDDLIEDHKTTSSMKWAKSPDKLKQNRQVLIYAKQILEEGREVGRPDPAFITVRHNIYCKDPYDLRVRKVEVQVTPQDIDLAWEQVQLNSVEMARLRRLSETWSDIPDPANPMKSCNAYGGCAYRSICSGQESEKGYEQRVDRWTKSHSIPVTITSTQTSTTAPTPTKGTDMSVFAEKMAARKAAAAAVNGGNAAPVNTPPINPPNPATNQPAPSPVQTQAQSPATPQQSPSQVSTPATAQVTASASGAPPWANPSCMACRGSGFNTSMKPCRICDLHAPAAGRPQSSAFVIEPVGDGTFIWEERGGATVGASLAPTAGQVIKSDEKVTTPAPAEEGVLLPSGHRMPLPKEDDPIDQVASVDPAPSPAPENDPLADEKLGKPDRRGRPSKGFHLMIGCAPIRGKDRMGTGKYVIYLDRVMSDLHTAMAKEAGVESYYRLDAFKRRDALAIRAEAICETFGSEIVAVHGPLTPDMKSLVDAILPFADMVSYPTAMA